MKRKKYRPDLMSVAHLGGRIITIVIAILLLLVIFILGSCRGPAKHLQLAKYHTNQAIKKGAEVSSDTTWHTIPIIRPEIQWTFDTEINPTWISKDTIRYEDKKTGAKQMIKLDLKDDCPDDCIERIYVHTYLPESKSETKVPVKIDNEIRAGYTKWEMIILSIACLAAGAVIGRLFWK